MKSIIVTLILALSLTYIAKAANEKSIGRLRGSQVQEGSELLIADNKASEILAGNTTALFTDQSVNNLISLEIDPYDLNYMGQDFQVTVEVEVTRTMQTGSPIIDTILLDVNYTQQGAYKNIHTYLEKNGGYQLKLRILTITPSPSPVQMNLSLKGEIITERTYTPNFAKPTSDQLRHSSIGVFSRGELLITWDYIPGAESYDLEWTYFSNYLSTSSFGLLNPASIPLQDREFQLNSTRVNLTNTYYFIPLLYEQGLIAYRVRARGVQSSSGKPISIAGPWSFTTDQCVTKTVKCLEPHLYRFNGHNEEVMWQSQTNYIEQGKSGKSVTYYDGSSRNRQTVNRLNTEDKTLISETIYDRHGRAAINVLPGVHSDEKIQYVPNFNRNINQQPYSWIDFDQDITECEVGAGKMDDNLVNGIGGASNYFSEKNPDKEDQQAFLPNAEQYPFSQVQYTSDGTGRIRKSGSTGETLQIGNGHETTMFYGKPHQHELDRLFGTEVGPSIHYQQHITIDPNGQTSVQYIDQEGNIIATALAGEAPANLAALPGSNEYEEMEKADLLEKERVSDPRGMAGNLSNKGNTHTISKIINVKNPSNHHFDYSLELTQFINDCQVPDIATPDCYNCVIDVKLSLKDECGNELFTALESDGSYKRTVGQTSIGCVSPTGTTTNQQDLTLATGEYTITRSLSINQQALDAYTANYLREENKCIISFDEIYEDEILNIEASGCMDCQTCLDRVDNGNLSYETSSYNIAFNMNCNPCLTELEFEKLILACDNFCDNSPKKCETVLKMLESDVSRYGQYGDVRDEAEKTISNEGVINPNATRGKGFAPEKHPLSVYNTATSTSADDEIFKNQLKLPNNFTLSTAANWRNPQNPFVPKFDDSTLPAPFYYDSEDPNSKSFVDIMVGEDDEGNITYFPEILPFVITEIESLNLNIPGNTVLVIPNGLAHLEDFLSRWRPYWAKSLVIYHPEFAYFLHCLALEEANNFEIRLMEAGTAEEGANLFQYSLNPNSSNNIPNPFGDPNNNLPIIDPYLINGDYIDPTGTVKRVTGREVPFDNFGEEVIRQRLLNYRFDTQLNRNVSLWEYAHIVANCPNFNPDNGCDHCIDDFDGINTDREWQYFRSFYLDLRQRVQVFHRDYWVNLFDRYNGLIGTQVPDQGRAKYIGRNFLNIPIVTRVNIFDQDLLANVFNHSLFKEKTKRFPAITDPEFDSDQDFQAKSCFELFNYPSTILNTNVPLYLTGDLVTLPCEERALGFSTRVRNTAERLILESCGQCPLAFELQYLLSALVREDKDESGSVTKPQQLPGSGVPFQLSCFPQSPYSEFTSDLEEAINLPGTGPILWDQTFFNGKELHADIKRSSQIDKCELKFRIPDNQPYDLQDMESLCCLTALETPQFFPLDAGKNFQAHGLIETETERIKIPIEGVSCLDIGNCVIDGNCSQAPLAIHLKQLLNKLIDNDTLVTASNLVLLKDDNDMDHTTPYQNIINGDGDDGAEDFKDVILQISSVWNWSSTQLGKQLSMNIIGDEGGGTTFTFTLFLPSSPVFDFEDILSIETIQPTAGVGGTTEDANVDVLVKFPDNHEEIISLQLTGSAIIGTCSDALEMTTNGM